MSRGLWGPCLVEKYRFTVYDGNGHGQLPDLDIADQAEELYSLVNGVARH